MTFNRSAIYWYMLSDSLRAKGFTDIAKKLTDAQEGIPAGYNVPIDFTEEEIGPLLGEFFTMLGRGLIR